MTVVERSGGDFVVDVEVLAETFGLSRDDVRQAMRDGAITSRCEAGVAEDEGRWRLTFYHRDRAFRLVVDTAGTVLKRASFPVQTRP